MALLPELKGVAGTEVGMTRVVGGLALIAGGAFWFWAALVFAGKPYGDTATLRLIRPAEPLSSTYRSGDDAAPFMALAIVLTLVGLALLYARPAWAAGGWGKAAVVLLTAGLLVVAPWPLLLVGFLGWVFGMLALAIAALRSGLLPRSAALMLIAAAALLFLFNTEDDRALFLIAPGAAWIWFGATAVAKGRAALPA